MGVRYLGDNAPDGMCIGSASTEKLAFFGATPVTQPAMEVAVGTDLATVILELSEIRAALVSLGLIDK